MATPSGNDGERTRPPTLLKKSKSLMARLSEVEKAETQDKIKTKCIESYPHASRVRRVLKKSQSAMGIQAEDVEGEMKEEASTSGAQPFGPGTAGPNVIASQLELGGPAGQTRRPMAEESASGSVTPNPT